MTPSRSPAALLAAGATVLALGAAPSPAAEPRHPDRAHESAAHQSAAHQSVARQSAAHQTAAHHDARAPSSTRGRIISSETGRPLRGIKVVVRDALDETVLGRDRTNRSGVFVVRGDELELESGAVIINGKARSFERGYVSCARTVVRTWGEACGHGPGWIGRIRLDRR